MTTPLTIFHAHATRENVGDDAIVIAVQKMLEDAHAGRPVEHISFCKDDRRLPTERVVRHVAFDSFEHIRAWPKLVSSMASADVVVIGGGELICGALEFIALMPLARILRRPVIMLGLGADSLSLTGITAWYTRFGLKYVDDAYVRDIQASEVLEKLGMQPSKIHRSADVVFGAGFDVPADAPIANKRSAPPSIALVLRATQRPDRALTYERLTVLMNCMTKLVERDGAELHIYPFTPFARASDVVADHEDNPGPFGLPGTDSAIAEVARKLLPEGVPVIVHPHGELTPAEVVRRFREHSVVISMRLHALILAALAGTRFVGIDYADKIHRVMKDIGADNQVLQIASLDDIATASRELDTAIASAGRFDGINVSEAQARLEGLKSRLAQARPAGPMGLSRVWRFPLAYIFLLATKCYFSIVKTRHPLVLASGRALKRGRAR